MQDASSNKALEKIYSEFIDSVENGDLDTTRRSLSAIDSLEKSFLRSYTKRKKEGVYYTNKEICAFISESSIYHALEINLKRENFDLSLIQDEETYKKQVNDSINRIRSFILDLTMCDPACGSGAFLISLAEQFLKVFKALYEENNEDKLKLDVLRNIKGFDINPDALKICVLKLFKWGYSGEHQHDKKLLSILNENLSLQNTLIEPIKEKYDIIVGNPPYGNILTSKHKATLKKQSLFHKDIYCAFILKVLDLSRGIIGLLVPKSFLIRQGYIKFRNNLLSRANLLKIYNLGSNIFKNATNEVQIMIYEKKNGLNEPLMVYDYPDNKIIHFLDNNVDEQRVCLNKTCPLIDKAKKFYVYTAQDKCPYCKEKTLDLFRIRIKANYEIFTLINKIESRGNMNYLNVRDFPMMIRGEESDGLKQVKAILTDNIISSCFFLSAKKDFQYYYLKKRRSFNIEEIDPKLLKGNDFEYYVKPKLLIKHNNIIPEAVYTNEKFCFTSSIYSLLHDDTRILKYLCAVLNSALIQFYCIYGINNQNDTTINLNQYMIRHLPIIDPKGKNDIVDDLIYRVDLILDSYKLTEGKLNNTIRKEEKAIDRLIFDLYSINEEERNSIMAKVTDHVDFFKNIYG